MPLKTGDSVGEIVVYYNNKEVKRGDLTVNKDINSLSFIKLLLNEMIDLLIGDF